MWKLVCRIAIILINFVGLEGILSQCGVNACDCVRVFMKSDKNVGVVKMEEDKSFIGFVSIRHVLVCKSYKDDAFFV